ncbi:hypothetical protein PYCCODRAFT_515241 [Trametes coccinea BRFM310]|uniref:Uncharacterized protein n=1 Tax=Trametes coccinea (strain BRFM310) TaxID=1353009 RepID=A0A1Y2IJX8_TRAC3|nr:hypothetical protein PYCCODRAFT_515241 [Trametes coccinea BRFM310]
MLASGAHHTLALAPSNDGHQPRYQPFARCTTKADFVQIRVDGVEIYCAFRNARWSGDTLRLCLMFTARAVAWVFHSMYDLQGARGAQSNHSIRIARF